MKSKRFTVRHFGKLTQKIIPVLYPLTHSSGSEFRFWLSQCKDKKPSQIRVHASLVYYRGKVVGWAAAHTYPMSVVIGVFIRPADRRKGLGTRAVDNLLRHMRRKRKDRVVHYDSTSKFVDMFVELIEKHGFH